MSFSLRSLLLAAAFLLSPAFVASSNVANAGLSYTCDASVSSSTCNYLNTTIAALYNNTFTNVNASIYIQYGATGLGESTTGYFNTISYSTYVTDLTNAGGSGLVRADAIASLPGTEPALWGGGGSNGNVSITSALGTALGITGLNGTTAGGSICTVGTSGCYNGIITITNDGGTPLYYRTGPDPSDAYDYYSVVEHETDEVLGTSSCISTQSSPNLVNGCTDAGATAAAVDLFRCGPTNTHVLADNTPGAYFSYNGCSSNGADGRVYNTLVNGDDFADFISGCPGSPSVQDATGCPGYSGLDITNDGGAEINILDAEGYNLASQNPTSTPEPMSLALLGSGVLGLVGLRRKVARG